MRIETDDDRYWWVRELNTGCLIGLLIGLAFVVVFWTGFMYGILTHVNLFWCLLRGHRPIAVTILDQWIVHGLGLQTLYEPDPDGDRIACERCGSLLVPSRRGKDEGDGAG